LGAQIFPLLLNNKIGKKMIKTFVEMQRGHRKEMERTSELAKTLEELKEESENNGGENIELITTDLCVLYCRIEQLAITIENNEKLGKLTSDIPTTPVTKIANSVYMPKS
jgi:hypothetical protein